MSRPLVQSAAMAPGSSGANVAALLRHAVLYHLDNSAHENALFFAERLAAQDPRSPESAFLLALCHFRLGDFLSAHDASKDDLKGAGLRSLHIGRAYIFAQSCLALERYRDGAIALERCRPQWPHKTTFGKHTASTRSLIPDAAALNCLLGKLYQGLDDKNRAVSCFEDALKLNPFMWDAFTSLCDMGVHIKVPNIFKVTDKLVRALDSEDKPTINDKETSSAATLEPLPRKSALRSAPADTSDPFDQPRAVAFQDRQALGNLVAAETEENEFLQKIAAARSRMAAASGPSSASDLLDTPPAPSAPVEINALRGGAHPEPPHAPMRKTRAAHTIEPPPSDAPPRMGYRGITKRRANLDPNSEAPSATEQPASQMLRTSASSLLGAEQRKRTISGHPVQSRPGVTEEPGAPQRRSARLNMFKQPSTAKPNAAAAPIGTTSTREMKKARPAISRIMRPGSSGSSVGRVVSGNRKPVEENTMDVDHVEPPKMRDAVQPPLGPARTIEADGHSTVRLEETLRLLMDLLKRLGTGYLALSQYQCSEAVQAFSTIPRAHVDTPWVLAHIGRAQYEQTKYAEAEASFKRLRTLAPNRLEDMEVYSTVLWHLKKETEASFLAHELVDIAWHSPHAWCALGNAWSLASDREQALRCFKRATQLDAKFAYAYTLQGHEHFVSEEYDKALTSYRHAIAADRRHYNAYYGIGRVYEKLGNYDKAYTHFHAASVIHPTNAVLICCIGTALEKQKQVVQALQFFTKATELAPRAAQTRFMKARALLALGQLHEAQKELMILKDLAPDEATVHFLLGKLYKTLNDKNTAVHHFTIALSLDPKASQLIKKAIESLEDDECYDDSMVQ
ncbi:anaphase-promoting complex subunit cdc27 [Pyricularia oryzae]|uniref:Uncharacterized protein n=2 Tax=Pyricularia TaxID=48558 RepID=A0ABQ8NVT9_PYRGI|nr:hypothetical protein MCOR26_004130 [Pyricularia oryzae]KAI6302856.1 hypothetical protein MCOR33_001938 [Pyricularia grisea]KAI6339360.1 hypothetical protein MCOR30_002756 [Pyricularia oryzae]KAI6339768.1 hypothetical protein MCOR28_007042 [Pyricularia oryzae]KAI6360221.1 hypothetical protein MCOR31_009179 [Pyricularia oryzae]